MIAVIAAPYEKRLSLREKAVGEGGRAEEVSFDEEALKEKAAESSLFGESRVYLLRDALEEEGMEKVLPLLAESAHLFVFEEDKITPKTATLVKKLEGRVFEAKNESKKEWVNAFALADALGARDKKQLWASLHVLLRSGAKPEELAGVLHWGARSMLIAHAAASAEEAKMKEFVFTKSRRYAKNYSEKELRDLSQKLVMLYHESHRGGGPLELLLERFALSL